MKRRPYGELTAGGTVGGFIRCWRRVFRIPLSHSFVMSAAPKGDGAASLFMSIDGQRRGFFMTGGRVWPSFMAVLAAGTAYGTAEEDRFFITDLNDHLLHLNKIHEYIKGSGVVY